MRTDNITIHFVHPPIPDRRFDWCAKYDNDEPDDDGNTLMGCGKTPTEAVTNLLENAND